VTAAEYAWDTSGLPDGYYIVRVEASDELTNSEPNTLKTQRDSEPFLIDNHAPVIRGMRIEAGWLQGQVEDAIGPITKLEMAIDSGEWQNISPEDGILDSKIERFRIKLRFAAAQRHIVAVRSTDANGNVGSFEIQTGTDIEHSR
jgi:hypothetical protein